ncbi:uncharacterized protein LOC122921113 [Bufo gargarizans]|uniref:uncharacterized protein LOC122921113 n=1 Tax=Bufo gargarizans TaxID=30331 RepID=UPI001CF51392|nr:uncharacterized protein LOC122921113 [Bufo gargarizans]
MIRRCIPAKKGLQRRKSGVEDNAISSRCLSQRSSSLCQRKSGARGGRGRVSVFNQSNLKSFKHYVNFYLIFYFFGFLSLHQNGLGGRQQFFLSTMTSSSRWWRSAHRCGTTLTAAMQTTKQPGSSGTRYVRQLCQIERTSETGNRISAIRSTIMVRWRSIRDRYKKDFNEELRALGHIAILPPWGSYEEPLSCEEHQAVLEDPQEAVPVESATAGPSRSAQATGQDFNVPLPVPSRDSTMARLAPLFEALMRRQRTGRSCQEDYEDLTRLVYKSLMGFTNRVATLEDNLRRLQEGAVLTSQMNPVHYYLILLLPVMEQFTPDQQFEARRQVDCVLWQVPQRPTSLPPHQPYPPSHTYPLSQPPHPPFQPPHPSPNPPSYFLTTFLPLLLITTSICRSFSVGRLC